MKKNIILVVTFILLIAMSGCKLYTVVPIETKEEGGLIADQGDKEFDSDEYASGIWTQVKTYTEENSAKIEDVLYMFEADKQKCIDEYCLVDVGEADTARFLVYGKVMILSVNRESKVGMMNVDIEPYDGEADAFVQIGPVYRKNAVRDSMPFIVFEDFKNQLAFGDAGKAINKYIDTNVVVPSGIDDKVGNEINLLGVFEDGEEIIITPIDISEVE